MQIVQIRDARAPQCDDASRAASVEGMDVHRFMLGPFSGSLRVCTQNVTYVFLLEKVPDPLTSRSSNSRILRGIFFCMGL